MCLLQDAVIHPLLKKEKLDPTAPSSYRPISKPLNQLTVTLEEHCILDDFQLGFCHSHSTERALLRGFGGVFLLFIG